MNLPKSTKYVPFSHLSFDPDNNPVRLMSDNVEGIVVKSNADFEGMALSIWEAGKIEKPLAAIQVEKDRLEGFQGFRRHGGAKILIEMGVAGMAAKFGDEIKAKQVFDELTKRIPVTIYETTGSPEGDKALKMSLLNDQDQRPYAAAGLLRGVWAMMDAGFGFTEIAKCYGDQILLLGTKGRETLAELRAEKNLAERDKKRKQAVKGRLEDEWMMANKLGPVVRKAFLTKILRQDSLTDEVPVIDLNRDVLKKLNTARIADGVDFHPDNGGLGFNAKLEEIKAEQAGGTSKPKVVKPSVEEQTAVLNASKSLAVRETIFFIQGTTGASRARIAAADANAFRMDEAVKVYLKLKDGITNTAVKDVLSALFNGDPLRPDFETALSKHI